MSLGEKNFSHVIPRLIRLRDAPFYLGMDRNRFNAEVRPYLTQIPIGEQGIAFDRLELDAWVEQYKSCNGRRPKAIEQEDDICQNVTECRGSASKVESGKLRNAVNTAKTDGSVKAWERLAALRQRST
jgi:hypothetical protein